MAARFTPCTARRTRKRLPTPFLPFSSKSRQGEALTARSDATRTDEMGLMAATHNLMILAIPELFYRAFPTPFCPLPLFLPHGI